MADLDSARDLSLRFRAWWHDVGAEGDPEAAWAAVRAAWTSPGRHYHTLEHLAACLDRAGPDSDPLVRGALFFHDAIYDVFAHDNEARSAAFAEELCREARLDIGPRIAALVLETVHDAAPSDPLARLVVDIDLSILGSDPARFDRYEEQVRAEYAWVPEPDFRAGRAEILKKILERPFIFSTPAFAPLEAVARENLRRSLVALQTGPSTS